MLRCRKNQICLPFSFWPEPSPNRGSKNLYELRSYTLRVSSYYHLSMRFFTFLSSDKFALFWQT